MSVTPRCTVQQSVAVCRTDTAWLTVTHTAHLVRTAVATFEPVTGNCNQQQHFKHYIVTALSVFVKL